MTKEIKVDFKNNGEVLSRFRQIVDCLGKRSNSAKIAGVTEDAIRKYMNGKAVPSIEVVTRLCLASDASIDWLMTGKRQIGSESPVYKLGAKQSISFSPGKPVSKGEFVYVKQENGIILIGLVEDINKDTYSIKPYNSAEALPSETIKKSAISLIAPAQVIEVLQG